MNLLRATEINYIKLIRNVSFGIYTNGHTMQCLRAT